MRSVDQSVYFSAHTQVRWFIFLLPGIGGTFIETLSSGGESPIRTRLRTSRAESRVMQPTPSKFWRDEERTLKGLGVSYVSRPVAACSCGLCGSFHQRHFIIPHQRCVMSPAFHFKTKMPHAYLRPSSLFNNVFSPMNLGLKSTPQHCHRYGQSFRVDNPAQFGAPWVGTTHVQTTTNTRRRPRA